MTNELRLPSLRRELVRLTTWVALGWLVVLALTVTWAVRREVDDLLDEALREAAEVMFGVLTTSPQLADGTASLPEVLPAPAHEEKFVWQIVDGQGRVVRRSHKAPSASLSAVRQSGWFDFDRQWRVYGVPMPGAEVKMLYVAQVAVERNEARYEAAVQREDLARQLVLADVRNAEETFDAVLANSATVAERLIVDPEAVLSIAAASYAEGAMSLIELLDAAEAYWEAGEITIATGSRAWVAYFDLERAVGGFASTVQEGQ